MMDMRVFCRFEIAPEEQRLNAFEKGRVGRHHIDELAVLRAGFAHHDLSVLFNNLCFEFAWVLVHQRLERSLAADDGVANFLDATRAKRISLSGKTKRW